jgi:predicted NBD/HSP70 family sugar kinase
MTPPHPNSSRPGSSSARPSAKRSSSNSHGLPAAATSRDLAYVQVASSELTRDINRDLILELIRSMQPISRVDLARASGLQPSTVSSIVEQLLGENWIREGAMVKTARGRRPTLLSLNDDLVILAADLRPSQAVVALLDLNGRFLARRLVPLSEHPEKAISSIGSAMQQLRDQFPGKTFEGAGVSLPGRVDPATNQLVHAPNLHWRNFDIHGALSKVLGTPFPIPVQLENGANASLLSELWFGRMDGVRNAVLVTISEGVGTAILAEGRLISGRHGLAGEFGHIPVDPKGPICGCGAQGCWEVFASSRAALRYYRELDPKAPRRSIVELVSLAIDGDTAAREALERQAVAIGQGLHILNAVLSPDVILFAGDITTMWEMSRDLIARECQTGVMAGEGPRLQSIGDGEQARLRGAAAVVLQRHSGYYRANHKRPEAR